MKTNRIRKILPLIILAGLIITAYATDLHEALSLGWLQAQKESFLAYKNNHFSAAIALFTAAYVIAVALSLPAASLITMLGGFLFGKILGTFLVVTSATIGATIIFLVARSAAGATLRQKAGRLYRKIEDNMQDNAVSYLLFMRLVPLFPFWLVNIVPALFNISLPVYILTTFFGIIPGSFVYVNVGEALGEIERPGDILSGELLLAFTLLGVFALIPAAYKKIKRRKSE